ncbi:hypothetical protein ILUMI_11721, partial [Ignelater luminosus]
NSARILGVFHAPAYSHYQLGDKILKELASRGHEVTVISPFPEKTPVKNFKQVVLTGAVEELEKIKHNFFERAGTSSFSQILWVDIMGLQFTDDTLSHPNVQKLLKSDEKFDLVIVEQFVNEAFRGFCYRFQAPCVVVSTVGGSRWANPQMGNPAPPSYVPDITLSLSSYMNFCERFYNSLVYLGALLFSHLYTFPKQNEILHKHFPDAPHLYDLYYNTSLMLMNSHVSTQPAVPYVPNMIEIGGYHVSPPKPLPKDLQDYLDNAKEGVIFFSMGSNLRSADLPKEKRDAILRVFSKLKQKVLWKWESETLPGQPSNVKLSKWLPQQSILAHPNVKVFITHGGLLSTIETIYFGVPVVGIPVFGDQEMNVANAEIAGYGIGVPFRALTEETLNSALDKILNDPKYTENAKRRSKIMHDQPTKPLDRAVFWVEYVLRHGGAPHLKTAALNLTWYQYLLLDVVAAVLLVTIILSFTLCKIFKMLCKKKSVKKVATGKKKN